MKSFHVAITFIHLFGSEFATNRFIQISSIPPINWYRITKKRSVNASMPSATNGSCCFPKNTHSEIVNCRRSPIAPINDAIACRTVCHGKKIKPYAVVPKRCNAPSTSKAKRCWTSGMAAKSISTACHHAVRFRTMPKSQCRNSSIAIMTLKWINIRKDSGPMFAKSAAYSSHLRMSSFLHRVAQKCTQRPISLLRAADSWASSWE